MEDISTKKVGNHTMTVNEAVTALDPLFETEHADAKDQNPTAGENP